MVWNIGSIHIQTCTHEATKTKKNHDKNYFALHVKTLKSNEHDTKQQPLTNRICQYFIFQNCHSLHTTSFLLCTRKLLCKKYYQFSFCNPMPCAWTSINCSCSTTAASTKLFSWWFHCKTCFFNSCGSGSCFGFYNKKKLTQSGQRTKDGSHIKSTLYAMLPQFCTMLTTYGALNACRLICVLNPTVLENCPETYIKERLKELPVKTCNYKKQMMWHYCSIVT